MQALKDRQAQNAERKLAAEIKADQEVDNINPQLTASEIASQIVDERLRDREISSDMPVDTLALSAAVFLWMQRSIPCALPPARTHHRGERQSQQNNKNIRPKGPRSSVVSICWSSRPSPEQHGKQRSPGNAKSPTAASGNSQGKGTSQTSASKHGGKSGRDFRTRKGGDPIPPCAKARAHSQQSQPTQRYYPGGVPSLPPAPHRPRADRWQRLGWRIQGGNHYRQMYLNHGGKIRLGIPFSPFAWATYKGHRGPTWTHRGDFRARPPWHGQRNGAWSSAGIVDIV